jgi:ABC transport system ATP-binding/permease protein
MNYLAVENIAKRYGDRVLFENITFHLNQGDRIALIAKNGTGKTSILKLILGEEKPDAGKISIHPHISVAALQQESNLNPENTVFQSIYSSENPILQAIADYTNSLETGDIDAMQNAMNQIDALDAWGFELRVKQILSELKVDFLPRKIKTLSGGQQKRVSLAKILVDNPDFLILDEPTNHLDLDMIEWLEKYLKENSKTLLLVSHDRYFLDAVCDGMIELDNGQLYKYQGDYTYYLMKKAEYNEMAQSSHEKARNLYTKELDWIRKSPQARTTKSKARIDAFFEVEKKAKRPPANDSLQIYVKPDYLGAKILELHNVSKSFNDKVLLEKFSYQFQKGDRVGVIGKNGAGKSTLLNLLAGIETTDTGKVVHGDTLKIGYYTQSGMQLKEDMRVLEVIQEIAEFVQLKNGQKLYSHQLLEHFLFDYKQQQSYVSRLSGGEKRRLFLLTILMRNPNFLILDEPTNDLDLMTLHVLEDYLMNFDGCFVIVSHDRHFMDKLVEHTFTFEGNGLVRDFPGNYSRYREIKIVEKQQEKLLLANKNSSNNKQIAFVQQPTQQPKPQISEENRKLIKKLEKQIAQLEEKRSKTTDFFNNESLTPQKIADLSKELADINQQLEEKEMEWLELMEG